MFCIFAFARTATTLLVRVLLSCTIIIRCKQYTLHCTAVCTAVCITWSCDCTSYQVCSATAALLQARCPVSQQGCSSKYYPFKHYHPPSTESRSTCRTGKRRVAKWKGISRYPFSFRQNLVKFATVGLNSGLLASFGFCLPIMLLAGQLLPGEVVAQTLLVGELHALPLGEQPAHPGERGRTGAAILSSPHRIVWNSIRKIPILASSTKANLTR